MLPDSRSTEPAQALKFGFALRFLIHHFYDLPFKVPEGQTSIGWIEASTNKMELDFNAYAENCPDCTVQDFLLSSPTCKYLCAYWDTSRNLNTQILPGDIGMMRGSSSHPEFQVLENWSSLLYPEEDFVIKVAPDRDDVRYFPPSTQGTAKTMGHDFIRYEVSSVEGVVF